MPQWQRYSQSAICSYETPPIQSDKSAEQNRELVIIIHAALLSHILLTKLAVTFKQKRIYCAIIINDTCTFPDFYLHCDVQDEDTKANHLNSLCHSTRRLPWLGFEAYVRGVGQGGGSLNEGQSQHNSDCKSQTPLRESLEKHFK